MSHTNVAPQRRAVARLYAEPAQARRAIKALQTARVPAQAISVLSRSRVEAEEIERVTGTAHDLEAATARRHPLSDFVDWLGRIESVVVPGFGAVMVTGNLRQDLAPTAATRGAITGALVGLGISVDQAKRFEESVLQGDLLLVVHGSNLQAAPDRIQAILEASSS
jgi:hypothetical protein